MMIVDRDRNIEPISNACYFEHPVIDDVDERLTQVNTGEHLPGLV